MEDRTTITNEPIDDVEPNADAPAGDGRSLVTRIKTLLGSKVLRVGFVLAAVALGAYAVADEWSQVRAGFANLGLGSVVAALGAVLLGLFVSMLVWRSLLSAAGSPVPLGAAVRIFFVGQIGKYLPGAVWPVLAQMELGRAQRIPRQRSASVAAIKMLMDLAASLLVAAVAVVPGLAGAGTAGYGWAFLAVPLVLIGLHPRVLNRVLDRLLKLARRPPQEVPLSGRAIVTAMAWALLTWILFGLSAWLLAVRLGASGERGLLLAVGGFAFAWAVGFIVIFAPAGAGVREVVLVAALSPVLDVGKATVVALASRLLTTLGDLIAAGCAAFAGRGRLNGQAAGGSAGPLPAEPASDVPG